MRPCLSPSQRARLYASRSTNVKPHTQVYVITIHLFMTHKLIYSPRQRTEKKFHSRSWLTFFIHSVTNANCYFICLHTRLVSHTLTPHEHTPTRWASNNLTAIRIDKNPYLDKYDSTIAAKQTHSAIACIDLFEQQQKRYVSDRSISLDKQCDDDLRKPYRCTHKAICMADGTKVSYSEEIVELLCLWSLCLFQFEEEPQHHEMLEKIYLKQQFCVRSHWMHTARKKTTSNLLTIVMEM